MINVTIQAKGLGRGVARHKIKFIKMDGGLDDNQWETNARSHVNARALRLERELASTQSKKDAKEKDKLNPSKSQKTNDALESTSKNNQVIDKDEDALTESKSQIDKKSNQIQDDQSETKKDNQSVKTGEVKSIKNEDDVVGSETNSKKNESEGKSPKKDGSEGQSSKKDLSEGKSPKKDESEGKSPKKDGSQSNNSQEVKGSQVIDDNTPKNDSQEVKGSQATDDNTTKNELKGSQETDDNTEKNNSQEVKGSQATDDNTEKNDSQEVKGSQATDDNTTKNDSQGSKSGDEEIDESQIQDDEVEGSEEKNSEEGSENEFSEWSEDNVDHGNRFAEYDEDRQEVMRNLLLRIKLVFEENKEKIELIPEDLIVSMSDDNYLEFRLPGYKYYVMHLTLEFKEKSGKHYAIMNSDDFVDLSRSVLYISEKRLEDQIDHLAGHLESFISFFYEHVNNRREFEELEDKLEIYLRDRFERGFGKFDKIIDTANYKRIEVTVEGEDMKNGKPMPNKFDIIVYKLDSKHFNIDLKGEIREMSMIVKIFLNDEEFDQMLKKIVHTAYENNQMEFSWLAVPDMILSVLDVLMNQENSGEQGGEYLQVERTGNMAAFGPENNTIQYKVMHIPGDDEDSDEEIIMNVNCYLFKDEFLPSIYFNVDSKVYQSEYLVPFISPSAEFSVMMLESVRKAYSTIKKITYDLADIDEQDVYTYDHEQIVDLIKDGITEYQMCERDDIKSIEVLDHEYDGIPFKEEKIFHTPKLYFTLHNIEMEEERTGFLVNCYNLETTKGDVGEYRIYETNYYDCKEDFENFVKTCIIE